MPSIAQAGNYAQMKIAVTGATGLLGHNVVRKLLDQGHQVRTALRPSSDEKTLQNLDVDVLKGDLFDDQLIEELIDGCEGLIHCAALIWLGKTRLEESRSANVMWTEKLAQACRTRYRKMVHVSTVDALAASKKNTLCTEEDINPPKANAAYVITKREAESVILDECDRGLNACIVNPGFFVGPWDWKPSSGEMILAIQRQFVPFSPGGGFSVADVRDVANGVIAAMHKGRQGHRYILGGENMRYYELFRRIAKITGGRKPIAPMDPVFARIVGFFADLIGMARRKEMQVNSAALRMGQLYQYYDSGKAKSELGYEINDVDQAITDAWQWFLEYGYAKERK